MTFSEIINPLNTRNNAKGAAPFRDAYDNPGSADVRVRSSLARSRTTVFTEQDPLSHVRPTLGGRCSACHAGVSNEGGSTPLAAGCHLSEQR